MKRFTLFIIGLLFFTLGNAGLGLTEDDGYELPAVTGPYGVGTLVLPMVDERRPGNYADGSHTPGREIMTQIWYPADREIDGPKSNYLDELTAAYVLQAYPELKNFLSSIKTHAVVGVKVAAGRKDFPVLIFSPGYGLYYSAYQSILEDLASHGYIVIGVNSPNIAGITAFPDGHCHEIPKFSVDDDGVKQLWQFLTEQFLEVANDLKFVVDQLCVLDRNKDFPLAGRINFSRVGCFGHSYGGATAIQACIDSPWVAATANFDGALWGEDYTRMIYKPIMLVSSENADHSDWNICWNNLTKGSYFIEVDGTLHNNFSDYYLILKAYYGSNDAEIDPERAVRITRDCVRTFFDCNLKYAHPDRMNKLAQKYQEIMLETKL